MKKEELETLVRQGLTNVEIGKVFGLNRNTIARNIKKFEIYKEKNTCSPKS